MNFDPQIVAQANVFVNALRPFGDGILCADYRMPHK